MPFGNSSNNNSDNQNSNETIHGGAGQSNSNNSSQTTRSTSTAASSSDSSKKDEEEERNIKNLQVLFGALLQYDRFNNEKNFSNAGSLSQKVPATTTTAPSANPAAAAISHAPTTNKTKAVVDEKQQQEAESLESAAATTTNQKYAAAAARSVAAFLCPSNQDIKETSLYQSTYRLLQWQRDNYMVGSDFANWRRDERVKELREMQQQQQATAASTAETVRIKPTSPATYREMMQQLPHYNDAATIRQALGPIQLATIAKDFIPSTTVHQVALPLLVALPGGPALYPLTRQSLVALILGQQDNMNAIMKSAIVSNVLQNPEYRRAMKKLSTKGYMMVSNVNNNNNNNNNGDIGMKSDGPPIS